MNIRNFKKDVEYLVGGFIDDCASFLSLKQGKEAEQVSALIEEAVALYNNMKDRANAKVSVKSKTYFAELRRGLSAEVDGLYEKLSNVVSGASPQE